MSPPTSEDFREALSQRFREANAAGQDHVVVNSRDLHRSVGGYPGQGRHRMPTCCGVMREALRLGDEVLAQPPKGKGASLTIRYRLPR